MIYRTGKKDYTNSGLVCTFALQAFRVALPGRWQTVPGICLALGG